VLDPDALGGCLKMNREEAIEELLFHCGCHSDFNDPRWARGFLQTLRPYRGLRQDAYDHLLESVRAIQSELEDGDTVDKRIVGALWLICFRARSWGLDPGGMLRRNDLINEEDQRRLEAWLDDLSEDIESLLWGADPEGPLAPRPGLIP
jgi:hypothetical protein